MELTGAERIQLEIETLLRHTMLKLRADAAALLRPRDEASLLLVARTELWPHDGLDQALTIWRYSRHALLRGEPVRRGVLTAVPLFARQTAQLEALLVCSGLPDGAPLNDDQKALFDLLVRDMLLGAVPTPRWDDLKAAIRKSYPTGSRAQIEAAMRETVEDVLFATRGNVAAAARRLHVPLRTLWNYIERQQIDTARFRRRLA